MKSMPPSRTSGRFYCYFSKWFKNERPVQQGFIEPITDADIASFPQYAPDQIRKNLVIGQPPMSSRVSGITKNSVSINTVSGWTAT